MREQQILEHIVRRQLRRGHQHGAHAVRPDAAEERAPAFLACHADQAVDGVAVISPLGRGQSAVVLHADIDDVGGVTGDAAKEAGGGCHGDEDGEGGRARVEVLEVLVYAEAGGGVGYLA